MSINFLYKTLTQRADHDCLCLQGIYLWGGYLQRFLYRHGSACNFSMAKSTALAATEAKSNISDKGPRK